MTDYHLSIILVSYNGWFWLEKTLTTLQKYYLKHTQLKVQTIVVDNASTDGTVEKINNFFPWVSVLPQNKNLGFAAANNVAIKASKSPFFLLLNSDMELTEASNFDLLIKFLISNPKAGLVSPRINLPNGNIDPASHRGEPTPWAALTYFLRLEKKWPNNKIWGQYHRYYKDLDSTHEIDAVSGAAMMVRRQAANKVGLLDEDFFMYGEDLDWCYRFRLAGWQIFYLPQVKIIHHKNKSGLASNNQLTAKRTNYHFYQTMLQYFDKHYSQSSWRWWRFIVLLVVTLKTGGKKL